MDPLFHIIIPALILISLRFNWKKVLLLSPFALLPDALWLTDFHRSYTHSILFITFIIILVYLISRRKWREQSKEITFITMVFLITHLILDVEYRTALLYPVVPDYFLVTSRFLISPANLSMIPDFSVRTEHLPAGKNYYSEALSTLTSQVLLCIFFTLITYKLMKITKRVT